MLWWGLRGEDGGRRRWRGWNDAGGWWGRLLLLGSRRGGVRWRGGIRSGSVWFSVGFALRVEVVGKGGKRGDGAAEATYTPFPLEGLEIHKLLCDSLVAQAGLVLLQQPGANLRVFGFRQAVFDVGLFETVERDDYAVDFGNRVPQVALGGCGPEFDFLFFLRVGGLVWALKGGVERRGVEVNLVHVHCGG